MAGLAKPYTNAQEAPWVYIGGVLCYGYDGQKLLDGIVPMRVDYHQYYFYSKSNYIEVQINKNFYFWRMYQNPDVGGCGVTTNCWKANAPLEIYRNGEFIGHTDTRDVGVWKRCSNVLEAGRYIFMRSNLTGWMGSYALDTEWFFEYTTDPVYVPNSDKKDIPFIISL